MNELVKLSTPESISNFSAGLKTLIVNNHLYQNIKGKNYVLVDGWQVAGGLLGITAQVESLENQSDEKIIKYRAEVSLVDTNGNKVGSGIAICTNKESGKGNFEEYAVASMAQTRATGKAYRLKLGWLMKIAGFESTPFDEIVKKENISIVDAKINDSEENK